MKTADLYIRVSTDEQADKGYSQRDQQERLVRYCESHQIKVRNIILEDYSAKTFNRPEWTKLLVTLKKQKGKTDLVLFTKWDRFSRNAGDAYQMISQLQRLFIEPQAIEQPLDLSIPENKMMLAIYLAQPEVENDRRALNVFYGMRRAKKEGRYMGSAPLGYINRISEDGKKFIAPKPGEAEILAWAFEELARGIFNTEQIWKMARTKGLTRGSKNNFWVAVRNPVYCGKIFIPAFKDEPARLVQGVHQPIISEALFYDVQDILDGRKKKQRTKILVDDNLPLRGLLLCPRCGRQLTGSASKGSKNVYYHYYHCISSCGARFNAKAINSTILNEIKKYVKPLPELDTYKQVIKLALKQQTKFERTEARQINELIEAGYKKLAKGRELLLSGDLDSSDYKLAKSEIEQQIEVLERRLGTLSHQDKSIDELLNKGISRIANLDIAYEKGSVEEKRNIVGSIFPEKLIFDGHAYRTQRINSALELIGMISSGLEGQKKGTSHCFSDLSLEVIPLGLEPKTHTLKVYCSTN